MNYVRSFSGSVSSAWNSINPATLSGAIDVIVVEQEDGSLACSPFHVRFGKFSLLRPYEKKVEFRINGHKQDYPMKLGEGGEAFFVFETNESVPEALQTSPLVSPANSPDLRPSPSVTPALLEPDLLELEQPSHSSHEEGKRKQKEDSERAQEGTDDGALRLQRGKSSSEGMSRPSGLSRAQSDQGLLLPPLSLSPAGPADQSKRPLSVDLSNERSLATPRLVRNATDGALPLPEPQPVQVRTDRSTSPPPPSIEDAISRALNLSKKLWTSNISNQVTDAGDLMLDMTGYKSYAGEALHAEAIARQLLSQEFDGPYDIGALIGADEKGNVWIYSSEEAKEAADRKASAGGLLGGFLPATYASTDNISDPGYHSDDDVHDREGSHVDYTHPSMHNRRDSDSAVGLLSQPNSPGSAGAPPQKQQSHASAGDPNKNYAKTLRLTSDQLHTMHLRPGPNQMAFTVNRATCAAVLWYWRHDVPIVISDIDGTITKSDVLGHVLNSIGRDWTHLGVAKLYTEIAANGYNFLYLTSRSVGQADTTRAYLDGVVQEEGYRLPKGPVILSPDRTIAALRREIYLRKPEIFKMACLRDIMALFAGHGGSVNVHESVRAGLQTAAAIPAARGSSKVGGASPFYSGFGNRLTDALSYRSVNIPSTRIFTINSNSEISLDLLSLNKYKTAYGGMREIVDHYFPPVGLLVKGGGEEFTDFNFWRDRPLGLGDLADSEDEDDADTPLGGAIAGIGAQLETEVTRESVMSEDEAGEGDDMLDSYLSDPTALDLQTSRLASVLGDEEDLSMAESSLLDDEEGGDGDDELEEGEEDDEGGGVPLTREQKTSKQVHDLLDVERTPRVAGVEGLVPKMIGLGVSGLDHRENDVLD